MSETEKEYRYAHNPNFCMIRPDADDPDDEDIVTGSQS